MPTIIDTENRFTYCPFCGEPGRLMCRVFNGVPRKKYAIGCINKQCLVKPRTEWVDSRKHKLEDIIEMLNHIWMRRVL